jgi:homoserine O-acetyltransferase
LYFTPEDVASDAAHIAGAKFRVIPSVWGHMAGSGFNPADSAFIEAEIKALLAS